MKTTCINHPASEPLIMIRQWQLEATEDHCAAALLSFFEYWHNVKLATRTQTQKRHAMQEKHGETPDMFETTALQWHSEKDLQQGILGLYGKSTIKRAIGILVDLGFLSVHSNPQKRYVFDKTRHFLFHPKAVHTWLQNRSRKKKASSAENSLPQAESSSGQAENSLAIPETTSEITPENTHKTRAREAEEDFPDLWRTQTRCIGCHSPRDIGHVAGCGYADEEQAGGDGEDQRRRKEELRAAGHLTPELDALMPEKEEKTGGYGGERLCAACNEPEGLGHVVGCVYAPDPIDTLQPTAPAGDLGSACQIYHASFPCSHEQFALGEIARIVWNKKPTEHRLRSHPSLHEFIHSHKDMVGPPDDWELVAINHVREVATWWRANRKPKDWSIPLMFSRAGEVLATAQSQPEQKETIWQQWAREEREEQARERGERA